MRHTLNGILLALSCGLAIAACGGDEQVDEEATREAEAMSHDTSNNSFLARTIGGVLLRCSFDAACQSKVQCRMASGSSAATALTAQCSDRLLDSGSGVWVTVDFDHDGKFEQSEKRLACTSSSYCQWHLQSPDVACHMVFAQGTVGYCDSGSLFENPR